MQYIKSPLNYVGGKYKLLNQIISLFPDKIDTFVDLFGGGYNVGVNVNANNHIYNDIESHVVELQEYFYNHSCEELLQQIDLLISKYSLSKENAEGYNKLRQDYNESPSAICFYTMLCYAFNYQIRFNNQGKFNMPFGKNRSSFNDTLRKKFISYITKMKEQRITFNNCHYSFIKDIALDSNDLVYCDPPYYNSVAAYNENGGWTEQDERDLLNTLNGLNKNNIRFALSNNLKYNNPVLEEWMSQYNVHFLDSDYSNCNYHKIDRSKDIEVLITNY